MGGKASQGNVQPGEFEIRSGQQGSSHPQLEHFSSVGDVLAMLVPILHSRHGRDVIEKNNVLLTSGILSVVFLKIYKKVGNMTFGWHRCLEPFLYEAKSLWKKPLMRARLGLEGRGLSWMDEFFPGLKNADEI